MADLYYNGLLSNSLWSYNTQCTVDDREEDNPIQVSSVPMLNTAIHNFIKDGPYFCDSDNSEYHNDHRGVNTYLYQDSYFHLIIETLFDVDQSQGAFITEKTYKCFKFGQPFVLIGAVNSLATLRRAGYRVFDNIIDNSYDTIADNTQRWHAVKETIWKIKNSNLYELYQQCIPDLLHNQAWFERSQCQQIASVVKKLTTT